MVARSRSTKCVLADKSGIMASQPKLAKQICRDLRRMGFSLQGDVGRQGHWG